MNSKFDPISSMAQMSQQLASSGPMTCGTPTSTDSMDMGMRNGPMLGPDGLPVPVSHGMGTPPMGGPMMPPGPNGPFNGPIMGPGPGPGGPMGGPGGPMGGPGG